MVESQRLIIDDRYCGPPGVGNGGYVSGLLAGSGSGPVEVTLRRPAPTERPLVLTLNGTTTLLNGDDIVAEARRTDLGVDVPEPVGLGEAVRAADDYSGSVAHPFPRCFVCGPERNTGDGLRIFPGEVSGREVVASPWIPHRSLAADDGLVRPEFVWAALDCAGAFVSGFPQIPMVLGRLTARLDGAVEAGRPYVVVGWAVGSEGRKHYAGTALLSAEGVPIAVARATWLHVAFPGG